MSGYPGTPGAPPAGFPWVPEEGGYPGTPFIVPDSCTFTFTFTIRFIKVLA